MHWLLPFLVAAIGSDVPGPRHDPEVVPVFQGTFDESSDEDFDRWPDGWTRRRGPGYPHYVGIRVADDPSTARGRCLRIDLDGGAAVAFSPPIPVGAPFSYLLEADVRTEGLRCDRACFSITFLDDQRQRLETFCGPQVSGTAPWRRLSLGPVASASRSARAAVIGLHLEPPPSSREDLRGSASFAELWLGRLPRLSLKTSQPHNLFVASQPVEIQWAVSGFDGQCPAVALELEDVQGRRLARHACPPAAAETPWQPPIPGPGFFRVRATMHGRSSLLDRQELSLVVIEPRSAPAGCEFGWSLPPGAEPLPLALLAEVVAQAGVGWLKFPLWPDGQVGDESIERLLGFQEQLAGCGIELVGVLGGLSQFSRSENRTVPLAGHAPLPNPLRHSPSAAEILALEPAVRAASWEPILMAMAGRIRWWQLGNDGDLSLVGYPNLTERLAPIRGELARLGQDAQLAIGWGLAADPAGAAAGLSGHAAGTLLPANRGTRLLNFAADPPMADAELAAALDASARAGCRRWVVLRPLPRDAHSVEVRASDLVQRMLAAKIHGADAVFCGEPFCTGQGLMNDDGTPGELFLPWRTAALELGGAKYLGGLQLAGGSPNCVFLRPSNAVMVVRSDRPTEEVIYLGDDVRQIDLWGGRVISPDDHGRQVLRVGPVPTLITGLSVPIARWQVGFGFAQPRLASIGGRPLGNALRLTNHFGRGIAGRAVLVMPPAWRVEPEQVEFRLAAGEPFSRDFHVTLPYDVTSGRHLVRVDFEIQADRSYRFSVYRPLEVGLDDVHIDLRTQLNDRGELEVRQEFVNETAGRVNFRCHLLAPGRRRLTSEILDLAPGRDLKTYRLPDGKSLLGKSLWLQAEEADSQRVLNYRFAAP